MLIDKDKIRMQFLQDFAGAFNRAGEIFTSLVTNTKYTGALEQVIQNLVDFATKWVESTKLFAIDDGDETQTGTQLFLSKNALSYIDETKEVTLKRKLKAIFYRNGDSLWGGARNIENVFKNYFGIDTIWVAENTQEYGDNATTNLIQNGSFAEAVYWVGENYLDSDARFDGHFGARLNKTAISQVVHLEVGTYFLHWMTRGKVSASLSSGLVNYKSDNWKARQLRVDIAVEGDYTVQFSGEGDVDYVRLFKKLDYPTFTVIVQKEGNAIVDNSVAVASDRILRPINQQGEQVDGFGHLVGDELVKNVLDYSHYYNKQDNHQHLSRAVFFHSDDSGYSEEIFTDLLDCVRPVGVRGFIEIVDRSLE